MILLIFRQLQFGCFLKAQKVTPIDDSIILFLSMSKTKTVEEGKKAVVIGSGVAGLAVAVRLAVRGFEVVVFEKNDKAGGKLTELRTGGYRFDAGPSLFTMPQWVDELHEIAGENPQDHFRYNRLPVVCKYFWQNGKKLEVSADLEKTDKRVVEEFGEKPGTLQNYLQKSRKKYELAGEIFLKRPLNRLKTWTNKKVFRALGHLGRYDLFKSLHKTNRSHFKSPEMVQLFDRYATYNGSDPHRCSGMFSMIPHIELHKGAYAPEGGMYAITEAIYQLGRKLGVRYVFGEEVSKILYEKNRVEGVELKSGERELADVVVSNMDVQLTYEKLLPDVKMPRLRKYEERSSSGFIFYWGIGRNFPQLDVHNIFFSKDYRKEFEAIYRGEFSDDPTIYVNITSKYNPADAPEGRENWFVMINGPNDSGQNWDEVRGELRKMVLERMKSVLDADLETYIECEEVLDPVRLALKTLSADGALYGSSSNSMMAAFLRQSNKHARLKNLYFCGGSAHPGGGIPLCLSSARIVDELLDEGL